MKTQLSFLKPKVTQVFLLFLIILSSIFFGSMLRAQSVAGDYTFSYVAGPTYEVFNDGTQIKPNTDNYNWDNFTPVNASLGFDFYFNGSTYTNCYINANGYITFGTTSSLTEYNPISAATGYNGAVAAFARRLLSSDTTGTSTNNYLIRYKTTGLAGSRVFTVQWKDARRSDTTAGKFNFQIKLFEGSNTVEVHYGANSVTSSTTNRHVQVGLRGATNSDFNNRTTSTNWATTTSGTTNNATNSTTATVRPVANSIYRWTLTKFTASTVLYGNGTWTAPCGPTVITVEAWGGGGGGGKASEIGPNGGGGGGAYSKKTFTVTAGDSFVYSVGAGGSGGGANNSDRDGKDSWFGSTSFLLAKAGVGVRDDQLLGGVGGQASASIGDSTYSGGDGGSTSSGNDSGGGGGAAKVDGGGGDGVIYNGGASAAPGGAGGNGVRKFAFLGPLGFGYGSSGADYGGGGGGGRAIFGVLDMHGGNGATGYMVLSYSYLNTGAPPPVTAISTLTPDPTTDIGCASNAVTLQASGGNTGAGVSTLWVKGTACPTFAYIQEFIGSIYTTSQTTVGDVNSGNHRFTSTGANPNIDMQNVLTSAINPLVHKYMVIRYRIDPIGTAGGLTKIYIKKSGVSGFPTGNMVSAPLNSDGNWHIMNIDMTGNAAWSNAGGTITGWRFDYATANGTVMDIDYLVLSSHVIEENTNADDTQITVDASDENTVFRSLRISDQAALCKGAIPYTGCIPVTLHRSDKTFTATLDNNWENADNWAFSGIPNSSNCVFVNNSKSLLVNTPFAVAKTIHVANNSSINITAGNALTVTNSITNLGSGSNFVVQNDANLVQINETAINTGNITVQRESPMKQNDYTYWSSPVTGQNLHGFSSGTSTTRFYEYHEFDDMFYNPTETEFKPGKGYAIMAPSAFTPASQIFSGSFAGVPNNGTNGTLQFPLKLTTGPGYSDKGYNMIGNPYPSNIDFEELFTINGGSLTDPTSTGGLIYNTAYFWTNVDPNRQGSTNGNGSGYSGNAYAIYNGTGGVSSTTPEGAPNGGAVPTQFIKVGQGFIVKAKKVGDLIFSNTIRTTADTHFFSKGISSGKDRYWLKLTTPGLDVNTILIGYVAGATNNFEWDYDAPLLSVGSDSFYSILNDEKLGIQGRTYPLNPQDIVNLGTKHFDGGTYTISLGDREGVFAGDQIIYLKDKQTGTVTDLTQGSYSFTANIGDSSTRFEIIYKPETVLITDGLSRDGLIVYRDGNDFVVKSQSEKITAIEVYDALGRIIFTINSNSLLGIVPGDKLLKGMYILKINQSGQVTTKKIIY